MSDFRLHCYRLLQQYPPVKYRRAVSDDHYELRILLIGSGRRVDTVFREILVNGQLLNTDLYLTVLTKDAAKAADTLLAKAAELKNYARVTCDNKEWNVPQTEKIYADIKYLSLGRDESAFARKVSEEKDAGCHYAVVSTGKDPKNRDYAEILSSVFESGDVIAFVQNKKPEENIAANADIFAFGFGKDTNCLEQLENIAYNLHYSYMKASNDRASNQQIRDTFADPYNFISNLEAAIHIREKLECCGIDTSDSHAAAERFAKLMEKDPSVVNRLAALEHRRWMMEKMLGGFVQLSDLHKIYKGQNVTTHDSSDKWHVCLVPCDETSEITLDDWKSKKVNSKLDPLDQMTLRIHAECGRIAEDNRELIEESLAVIRDIAERVFRDNQAILLSMRSLELAISQMWQGKRSAMPIYEGNLQTLLREISAADVSASSNLQRYLDALNDALAPLKEYISCKDYKNQDRLLIRQIPFALTHKKQSVLIKLLAENETDSVFSSCRLEPELTAYVGVVAAHDDYLKLKEQIVNISRFLRMSYPAIAQEYHIILRDDLTADHREKIMAIAPESIRIHVVDDISYEGVSRELADIAKDLHADYIDVTNGRPVLMMCAPCAGVPIIAHESGSLINILNAPEIRYPVPRKVITVKEMFNLSGAVLVEDSDSSVLSDLSGKYKRLFDISKRTPDWSSFCQHVATYYKNQSRNEERLPVLDSKLKAVKRTLTLHTDVAAAMAPVFAKLAEYNYISDLTETRKLPGQRTVSFEIAGKKNAEDALNMLYKAAAAYTPTMTYKVTLNGQKPTIVYADLSVRDMELPADMKVEYKAVLDRLAANNLLIGYSTDSNQQKYSFQFASKDILSVFQSSGKVLEYYIYYSALLDAHFDDVEMGWHFQHTVSEDSADNELDIICTRGISSLFISAKNGSQKKILNDSNNLKYVIYEISLLADRFGINARPVLAMPEVNQFQINASTQVKEFSKEVKAAYTRGVYLLGKECFENDVLGRVLDRIADGRDDWCDFLKSSTV